MSDQSFNLFMLSSAPLSVVLHSLSFAELLKVKILKKRSSALLPISPDVVGYDTKTDPIVVDWSTDGVPALKSVHTQHPLMVNEDDEGDCAPAAYIDTTFALKGMTYHLNNANTQ